MKFTKEKLLSLVKQNINEMAMDFDTPDRPAGDIQRKLQSGDTPLRKIPLPQTGNPNQNFQELLASQRYRQVIQKLRYYTNFDGELNGMSGMGPLMEMMGRAHYRILEIENTHKRELEELAVRVVKNEIEIPEGIVEFDAKIIGMNQMDTSDFLRERGQQQPNPEEVNVDDETPEENQELAQNVEPENQDIEVEIFNDLTKNVSLWQAKRQVINNIIQGASKRGHFMFATVPDELIAITGSDEILRLYGVMMAVNDANYWQLGEVTIRNSADEVAGKVKVERPDENGDDEEKSQMGGDGEEEGGEESQDYGNTKIIARGINFPVLIHELIKGVYEVLAVSGQPKDSDTFNKVEQSEDTLEKEMWNLMLGPAIWDMLVSQLPDESRLEGNRELQLYIFQQIFALEPKQFLILIREILGETQTGRDLLNDILTSVKNMLQDDEYQEAMEDFNQKLDIMADNTDEDSLMNELKSLGFNLPSNDDDEESDDDFLSQFK